MITVIEKLPNELLTEIFQYLPTKNLFESFYNLNLRLNSIIDGLPNLFWIMEEDWDDPFRTIPTYSSHIKILIVKHDEPIDFISFPNIHSLKLSRPSAKQCNAIQPEHLPSLRHLSISNFFFSNHSEQLCSLIFSSQFDHLRACHIDRISFYPIHRHSSVSLRQLTLSPSTWQDNYYPHLFDACPQLVSLRLIRLQKLQFSIAPDFTHPHRSIRHLSIEYHSMDSDWFDHLDALLSVLPDLEAFNFIIHHDEMESEFSFQSFADVLKHRSVNLVFLRAKISLNHSFSTKLHVIQELHPLFGHVRCAKSSDRSSNAHLHILSESY